MEYSSSPNALVPRGPQHEELRFWLKVKKTDECWIWTAARFPNGYGNFRWNGKSRGKAHQYSYILHYGPIPDGMEVCHTCNNKPCVRPDHLYVATHKKNIHDYHRSHTPGWIPPPEPRPRPPGASRGWHRVKYTHEQVAAAFKDWRESGDSITDVADRADIKRHTLFHAFSTGVYRGKIITFTT